ncbi:MAG: VOC family protein [Woeseiaceae bacterium]|nr:VOC family protein [Woeseiaceae bacterium]
MSINDIIGDGSAFFADQRKRLESCGIDITGYPLSHLAYRTETHTEYLEMRDKIERFCTANVENVWNGRPISKMLLKEPLDLGNGFSVPLIELLPPPHRAQYKMGLEHTGVVIGDEIDSFANRHRDKFAGQQHQNEFCEPWFVSFDDHTNVKFYRYSLGDVVIMQGMPFDGFHHVDEAMQES